jgi:hypothetical protein
MPNAKVTWSFVYGAAQQSRDAGKMMLDEAVQGLKRFFEAGGQP